MAIVSKILLCLLVASWNSTARQTGDMIGNLARAGEPNPVLLGVIHEVFKY